MKLSLDPECVDMSWKVNMLSHIAEIKDSIELSGKSRVSINMYFEVSKK